MRSELEKTRRDLAWPIGIIAGLGLVIVTNIVMVNIALGHRSAPVSDDPFGDGLRHDAVRAERESARALGWSATVGRSTRIKIAVVDAERAPIDGLQARVLARRADTTRFDRTVALEAAGDGTYRASEPLAAGGLYELEIQLVGPHGERWIDRRRAMLRRDP